MRQATLSLKHSDGDYLHGGANPSQVSQMLGPVERRFSPTRRQVEQAPFLGAGCSVESPLVIPPRDEQVEGHNPWVALVLGSEWSDQKILRSAETGPRIMASNSPKPLIVR